jgi:hypothetical protein
MWRRSGTGSRHDIQRVVAADEHYAAQQAGGNVVAVAGPRGYALARHGALEKIEPRQGSTEQLVDRHGGRHAAGRRAAEAARETHPLAQAKPNAWPGIDGGSSRRCPLRRGRVEARKKMGRRHAGHVLRRVEAEVAGLARDLRDLDPGPVADRRLDDISGTLQGKPEHVEPWPEVRHAGGRENGDSLLHRHAWCRAKWLPAWAAGLAPRSRQLTTVAADGDRGSAGKVCW